MFALDATSRMHGVADGSPFPCCALVLTSDGNLNRDEREGQHTDPPSLYELNIETYCGASRTRT